MEVCHHNDVVRLKQISLRKPVGQGRYQELGDILLLRVQISRLEKMRVEGVERPVFSRWLIGLSARNKKLKLNAEERNEPGEPLDQSETEEISYG